MASLLPHTTLTYNGTDVLVDGQSSIASARDGILRAVGIVKLTKSPSIDPQDTELQPVANPPCWASKTTASLNLTVPDGHRSIRRPGIRQK